MRLIILQTFITNIIKLRARTDYNPVGSEGAISLKKFLERLPNLEELRCIIILFNILTIVVTIRSALFIGYMETNSRAVTLRYCHQ